MTIFNNILFLQDYASDSRATGPAGTAERSYAEGYGNHIASARVFAPLGHASDAGKRQVGRLTRSSDAAANDPFPLGACG